MIVSKTGDFGHRQFIHKNPGACSGNRTLLKASSSSGKASTKSRCLHTKNVLFVHQNNYKALMQSGARAVGRFEE